MSIPIEQPKTPKGNDNEIEDLIKSLEYKREEVLQQELKRQKVGSLFTWVSLITAMLTFGYFIANFISTKDSYKVVDKQTAFINQRLDSLTKRLIDIQKTTTNTIDTNSNKIVHDREFIKTVDKLKSDLEKLNGIILENPEKALSLPLLRKEIAELKSSAVESQETFRNDIARIYDLFKWVGGLIFTLLLSLLGLAFSNVFFKKKDTIEKDKANEDEIKKLLDEIKQRK